MRTLFIILFFHCNALKLFLLNERGRSEWGKCVNRSGGHHLKVEVKLKMEPEREKKTKIISYCILSGLPAFGNELNENMLCTVLISIVPSKTQNGIRRIAKQERDSCRIEKPLDRNTFIVSVEHISRRR